jgi:hypothetical protein
VHKYQLPLSFFDSSHQLMIRSQIVAVNLSPLEVMAIPIRSRATSNPSARAVASEAPKVVDYLAARGGVIAPHCTASTSPALPPGEFLWSN